MSYSLRSDDRFAPQGPLGAHGRPAFRAQPAAPRPPRYPMALPLALIATNVAVWVWNVFSGVGVTSPKTADLEAWGGNIAFLTLTEQPWRLFTSMFLHAGVMHLFFNMYFLFQIGPLLVWRKGHAGFAVVYLCGGLLASVCSSWWQAQNLFVKGAALAGNGLPPPRLIVSVGASGAIMAVAGALACHLALAHGRGGAAARSSGAERQLMQSLLQVIAVNVAMGFFITGLDQAAHLGGLLAGALLAVVLPSGMDRLSPGKHGLRTVAAIGLSAILLLGIWHLGARAPQMLLLKEHFLQPAGS